MPRNTLTFDRTSRLHPQRGGSAERDVDSRGRGLRQLRPHPRDGRYVAMRRAGACTRPSTPIEGRSTSVGGPEDQGYLDAARLFLPTRKLDALLTRSRGRPPLPLRRHD